MRLSAHYYDVVKIDLIEAKDWYRNQKPGLEKNFAFEVKSCIQKIQKDPLIYEIKYRNVRTAFTAIFPYAVHFFIDELKQQIVIIAIIHQSRNPSLPLDRSLNE